MARLYPDTPLVAVGVVVIHEGKVLLVRRGNAPSKGLWAVPGGRVELGETLMDAAAREVLEETGIVVSDAEVLWGFDKIERDEEGAVRHHYVVVDLQARYVSGRAEAGDDASDVGWFTAQELAGLSELSPVTKHLLRDRMAFR